MAPREVRREGHTWTMTTSREVCLSVVVVIRTFFDAGGRVPRGSIV